jgi:Cu-Zn family superoxide dismutase
MQGRLPSYRLVALGVCGALACAPASRAAGSNAQADLGPASGSQGNGTVILNAIPGGVHLQGKIAGLRPGAHGFHVHEVGDGSAPDASSAKGHFKPTGKPHGAHAGDLPDLNANAAGTAMLSADVAGLALDDGAGGILNRALAVHADPDDHVSQPAGNSGERVACGVIKAR